MNSYATYAQKDSIHYEIGKTYFRTYCSSCHSIHQEIYGPMLGSISKKKEEPWLVSFIQNSQNIIKSGDTYAQDLFERFNNQVMPSFEHLSQRDIQSILYYIEIESIQASEHMNDTDIPSTNNASIIQGKQEFLEHCSACHFIHKESTFAPALGSATKRHSREWLISFIQNSQKKIQNGDSYAQHLFNQFDKHVMTKMNFLSTEEIYSILDFIDFASTTNSAYKGKINKSEYKKQAAIQIKEVSSRYSVITLISLIFIATAFFSMLFLLSGLYIFITPIKTNH
ncbi:MAG TPA: c-type cytochrome [Cytophaga sp.]|nr:c-type cytochrome [Cytophaga sp.]